MTVVDELVSRGRDPLEALFEPCTPDVAKWLAKDEADRLDYLIERELMSWPKEMQKRLVERILEMGMK